MATTEYNSRVGAVTTTASPSKESTKSDGHIPRRRTAVTEVRRGERRNCCALKEKRKLQKGKRRGQEEKVGVTVKRTWSGGKRRWDKKHYCVFCRRPQVKIARHLLRKHADEKEVAAASTLPTGSKQRHLLLEQLRCRGNYLHNIEVIRQGRGEIVPWRQPSQEVDARNYLPCPLCLGFFLRADLWKHQASCRRKMASESAKDSSHLIADMTCDSTKDTTSDSTGVGISDLPEDATLHLSGLDKVGASEHVTAISELGMEPPRKRCRVQAAASRLLPICSEASESCSEILHRMNQDHVSYQVKSDWLICKYGNTLMGNQESSQMRYDYVSQKLRKLGKFLLAAKSLDSGIQNLQDLLAPRCLSLALAAARKASGYQWSRPPLAVKTTLKAVCEIAIGESLQDGDWETAARTTDFYHLLGRDWDNLGLLTTKSAAEEENLKNKLVQSRGEKKYKAPGEEDSHRQPQLLSENINRKMESIPKTPVTAHKKVQRRPWSSAEKEAVWRQLGVHVLVQTVPGKEVCQRCLDLEPVLRGRHWKDVKNQVHNQIQSQKKQQFHAQMDIQQNGVQQDLPQNPVKQQQIQMKPQLKVLIQNQKKQLCHAQLDPVEQIHHQNIKHQYQTQTDQQDQDNLQNKQQCQAQIDHQDHIQVDKKEQYHARLDNQEHIQDHRRHIYHMDRQNPGPQINMNRVSFTVTDAPFVPDGTHGAPEQLLDKSVSPYGLAQRTPGPHMDQMLSRTIWTDECLGQNLPVSKPLARNLLQDLVSGGHPSNPYSRNTHY
ncbi:uncharacterized protein LOC129167875 isoform X2 [Dunckerocampus dactyliophorus]|uniref:uncharacterized protein LOC129167875 isoform X2 n=1 Tax=Dunckerocampus dactyliophorus TaxID=161453 RepID=UPI002405EE16|nr:uncharacterized protein LOC129167875 isoform X2 [Dunckerocampus dactyliophorus]